MLIVLILCVLGCAPGVFWLWYFYTRDSLEPEPKRLIVQTFFWGVAAVIPALLIETLFFRYRILCITVVAPVAEEFCKFCAVWLTVYRNREFDEPMDGIMYAAAAALGFASLENVCYLFAARREETLTVTFILRTLFSVPGHALFSSMWGYALGLRKCCPRVGIRVVAAGLILAMVLHGLFNTMGAWKIFSVLVFFVLVPGMWIVVNRHIVRALSISPHGRRREKP